MSESTLPPDADPPDLDALAKTLKTWGGELQILVGAYGNFQVRKNSIPLMLEKFWVFSGIISEKNEVPAFAEVYSLLCEQDIPTVRQGGIVIWLLSCDLAEYGTCLAPTATDLAKHMLEGKSKPAGPAKGLEIARKMAGGEATPLVSVKSLTDVFEEVMAVLENPNSKVVLKLVEDCKRLQGRKFSVADLEHGLCKISREERLRGKKEKPESSGER